MPTSLCPGRDFVNEQAIQQRREAAYPRCGSCNIIFVSQDALKQHKATKHIPKFTCDECATELSSQRALDRHRRSQHPRSLECTSCDRKFTTLDGCEQHKRAKHPYPCSNCGVAFNSSEARELHEQTVHCPTCSYCDLEFSTLGEREQHERSKHANRCHLCCRDFGSSEALQQHCGAKHPLPSLSMPLPISQGSQRAGALATLSQASSTPTSSVEAVSVEPRTSNTTLSPSEAVSYPGHDAPTKTPDLECQCTICERAGQPCLCAICKRGKEVAMAPPLCGAPEPDEPAGDNASSPASDGDMIDRHTERTLQVSEFHCQTCLQVFKKDEDLQSHACHHLDNGPALHCPRCYTQFDEDVSFQEHVVHSQTFLCELCEVQCCTHDMLKDHIQTHPTCQKCDKSFVSTMELCIHWEREHPVVVVCWECEGAVIYQSSLEQHYADSPDHPSCVFCGAGMKNMDLMDEHLSSQHAAELQSSTPSGNREGVCNNDADDQTISVVDGGNANNEMEHQVALSELHLDDRQVNSEFGALELSPISPPQTKLPIIVTPPPTPFNLHHKGHGYSPPATPVGEDPNLFGPTSGYICPCPSPAEHGSPQPYVTTYDAEKAYSPQCSIGLSESSYYDMSAPTSPLSSSQSVVYVSADTIPNYVKENRAYLVATSAPSRPSSAQSSPVRLPSAASSLESLDSSPTPAGALASAGHNTGVHRLHCRICHLDPCEDMTATICGHIFCKRCITQAVVARSECPVCQSATLLYCLFKLDLSA